MFCFPFCRLFHRPSRWVSCGSLTPAVRKFSSPLFFQLFQKAVMSGQRIVVQPATCEYPILLAGSCADLDEVVSGEGCTATVGCSVSGAEPPDAGLVGLLAARRRVEAVAGRVENVIHKRVLQTPSPESHKCQERSMKAELCTIKNPQGTQHTRPTKYTREQKRC